MSNTLGEDALCKQERCPVRFLDESYRMVHYGRNYYYARDYDLDTRTLMFVLLPPNEGRLHIFFAK